MSSSSRRRAASPPRGGVGKLRMDRQPIVTRISGMIFQSCYLFSL